MLDRFRGNLEGSFLALGAAFAKLVPSPGFWTAVGVALSFGSAAAFWNPRWLGATVGGVLLLMSGFFDIVDGAVARKTGRASKRGAFLDSTLDRVSEVAVFAGILGGRYAGPLTVLLAAALSLLVSYTRARAESLGTTLAGVGIGERSERLLVLGIASVFWRVDAGVVIVVALAGLTFVERTVRAARALD